MLWLINTAFSFMLSFFIKMFPSFLYKNPIVNYIVNHIGKDLNEVDGKINSLFDYDI